MSTTIAQTPSASRFAGLDTLRGLAILRIVLDHFTGNYRRLFGHHGPPTFEMHRSDFSVPMFFVISGFVIPMTIQKCSSLGDFAFRRASRLYPTFLVCIALTYAAVSIFGLPGREVSTADAIVNLTMIPHALGSAFVEPACWTLQVEVTFYAIMGCLMVAGWLRSAPAVLLAMALLHALSARFGWEELRAMFILKYAHLFAIGLLLFEMRKARRGWHFAAFVAVWVVAYLDRGAIYLVWIGVFFALTALSVFVNPRILRIKPFVWLGAVSYPLYLLHNNIGLIILRAADAAGWSPYLGILLALAVVVPLAYAIHRFVELPATKWVREARQRRAERTARLPEVAEVSATRGGE